MATNNSTNGVDGMTNNTATGATCCPQCFIAHVRQGIRRLVQHDQDPHQMARIIEQELSSYYAYDSFENADSDDLPAIEGFLKQSGKAFYRMMYLERLHSCIEAAPDRLQ